MPRYEHAWRVTHPKKVWRSVAAWGSIYGLHFTGDFTYCFLMPHKLYDGPTRKLVLAFDIGTTHSGVAYAFLDPGEVPEIHSVTK